MAPDVRDELDRAQDIAGVERVGQNGPPRAPEGPGGVAAAEDEREPEEGVADGGAVAALEELAHGGARDGALIPLGLGEAALDGARGVFAGEGVVELGGLGQDGGAVVVVAHTLGI